MDEVARVAHSARERWSEVDGSCCVLRSISKHTLCLEGSQLVGSVPPSRFCPWSPGGGERHGTRTEAALVDKRSLVAVVDDSQSVRDSLPDLLQQVGWSVQAFASAEEFLSSDAVDDAGCLVLDVGLPGMSGPDLQRELRRRGKAIPIVFITAQGDKSLHPRLVAAGAIACLFKPFSDTALLDAVDTAFARDEHDNSV